MIQACEVRLLRRNTVGVSRRVRLRSEIIRQEVKEVPIQDVTERINLRLFSHVMRIEDYRLLWS